MTRTRKKVIVRRSGLSIVRGYLPSAGFVRQAADGPAIEILDLEAKLQLLPLQQVRAVYFVRDFNVSDNANPERLPRRTFLSRPRMEGLWIRLTLREEEQIEGLAPLDLSLVHDLVDDHGLQFTPPDVRGNTQRMYIPRSALLALQVVATITTPSRRRQLEQTNAAKDEDQLALALAGASQAGEKD